MNTIEYLKLVGDSHSEMDMLAVSPDQSLFLVKDSNRLCYVTTPDMLTTMPYKMAIAEGMIGHFAIDSPLEEVQRLVVAKRMRESKVITITLTDDDLEWLRSDSISQMVHSVESHA